MLRNRALILFSLLLAAVPIAAQARKSHVTKKSAVYHGTASKALVKQLTQYYAYQDSGWKAFDATRVVSRCTADYFMKEQTGAVIDYPHYVDQATGVMQAFAEKGVAAQFHTTIEHVSLSGNTAIVVRRRSMHISLTRQDGDVTALGTGNATGFRNKDTWIHLAGGWYMAYSENLTQGFDISAMGQAQ